MMKFDVAVIGAGPGGYVAAIRCAQLGLNTVCIDKWENKKGEASLGGTCLNVGCIPSKALLESSYQYYNIKNSIKSHGIKVSGATIDIQKMMKRKDKIVNGLTGGIATLFLKNKIEHIHGAARLLSNKQIEVDLVNGTTEVVQAGNIIIATGSVPTELPFASYDHDRILDSSDALELSEVPAHLGIIGGGVIGLEIGSVWSRLGSKVTLLNRGSSFLPLIDRQLATEALRIFTNQGMDIKLAATTKAVDVVDDQVVVTYEMDKKDKKLKLDRLLVAAGRKPNTMGLNTDAVGLNLDEAGYIEVNEQCATNLKGVYAIGDVIQGPMLAHKASEEGIAVAERIAGQTGHVNYSTIPSVIYTHPEIASLGKTIEQLTRDGIEFNVGVYPYKANARAHAANETEGMVKILSDAKNDRILGVHILGAQAAELIGEMVVAMEFSASAEDIARTVHAHPTFSESIHEAALAANKRAIHI